MKNILILFIISSSLNLNSQNLFKIYNKGVITYKDGKTIEGFIKFSFLDDVKFKKTKNDKKEIIDYKYLKKIKFYNNDEYHFKNYRKSLILLKAEQLGKLNLYSRIQKSYNYSTFNSNSKKVYYLGKQESKYVEILPFNNVGKKFREIFKKFTYGCSLFQEKIKNKKSIQENFKFNSSTEKNMVYYYNYFCKDSKLKEIKPEVKK